MGQTCRVCQSDRTREIDELLVSGTPTRNIAKLFRIGASSVYRHKMTCLPKSLVKAAEARTVGDANTVVTQVQALLTRAWKLCDIAEHAKDYKGAISGVRAVQSILELLAKLSGELQTNPTVTTNVVVALMGLNDDEVKEKLDAAGHQGWYRCNPSTPARNDEEIFSLGVRLLRNLSDDEFQRALIASGKGEAFLPSKPN